MEGETEKILKSWKGCVVGCSLGNDGEAFVFGSLEVDSEDLGGEKQLVGIRGVLRSTYSRTSIL